MIQDIVGPLLEPLVQQIGQVVWNRPELAPVREKVVQALDVFKSDRFKRLTQEAFKEFEAASRAELPGFFDSGFIAMPQVQQHLAEYIVLGRPTSVETLAELYAKRFLDQSQAPSIPVELETYLKALREKIASDKTYGPILQARDAQTMLAAIVGLHYAIDQGFEDTHDLIVQTAQDTQHLIHNLIAVLTDQQKIESATWHVPTPPLIPEQRRFVGRAKEIDAVTAMLQPGETVTITAAVAGAGGIGKTYLADHLATELRDQFPGGVFRASLGPDAKDPASILQRILPDWAQAHPQGRTTDPADITPELVTAWLADDTVRPGRILALLDDVWHDAPARALKNVLPPGSACIVTTRNREMRLGGRIFDLDRLTPDDALALLHDRLGKLDDEQEKAARKLITALGGHALALEIAADKLIVDGVDQLPHYVQDVLATLQTDNPLGILERDFADTPREKAVEATLKLSYDVLTEGQQRRFRALGAFPQEIDYRDASVYAVWDVDQDDADALKAARDDLLALFRLGLLQKNTASGRYSQHAVLTVYARALAQRASEWIGDLARYIEHVIYDIMDQFHELPQEQWNDTILVDREHIHFVGDMIASDVEHGLGKDALNALAAPRSPGTLPDLDLEYGLWAVGREFAAAANTYVLHRSVANGRHWLRVGLACARLTKDQNRERLMVFVLPNWYLKHGILAEVLAYFETSLAICRAQNDRRNEAVTLNSIGHLYRTTGHPECALEFYQQALPITREVGARATEAITLNNLGSVHGALGQPQHALEFHQQALFIAREVGNREGEAATLNNLGSVHCALGQSQRALEFYKQALSIMRANGDRAGEATTLNNIATIYWDQGETERAIEIWRDVAQVFRELGMLREEAGTYLNLARALERFNQTEE
ncbi:MAG: tetratricopeptide repeat protein, partial [Anaerolineae bacterium]|nr:tetratricopeptide repeat protein [Anaerolineae bacterium]